MKYTKFISIAVSLLITVGLITLAISAYRHSKAIVQNSESSTQNISEEWNASDIYELTSHNLSGSEVLNSVRRYKDDLNVSIKKSSTDDEGKKVVETIWDSSMSVSDLNDTSKQCYVNPNNMFTCDLEETHNGDVMGLIFMQETVTSEDPSNASEVHSKLVELLGKDSTTEWSALYAEIGDNATADLAKDRLVEAVGADSNVKWSELTTMILEKMSKSTSEDEQLGKDYEGSYVQSGELIKDKPIELENNTIISIILYNEDGKSPQTYVEGKWYFDGKIMPNNQVVAAIASGSLDDLPSAYLEKDGTTLYLKRIPDGSVNYKIIYRNN